MSENLPRFYYLSDNKSELLPEWAYFFMQLGYQLATVANDNHRIVIGLAIPARVFACSLVATGIILTKAGNENFSSTMQIQYINGLKPGTPVYVRADDNRKYHGIIKGFIEFNGEKLIKIRTGKSEIKGYKLNDYASRITVSDQKGSLPKYQKRGYPTEVPSEFLRSCLGKELAQKHILDSSFEALLIGKKMDIKHEIKSIPLNCKTSGEPTDIPGFLHEILRVRQFSGRNKSYSSQWVSSSNINPEKAIGKQPPHLIVFDGAVAYIKLGHKWQFAHQVVLLDRTESNFFDAIELLNQNYTYRSAGGVKFPIKIPNGIEMMVYRNSV